MNAKIQQLQSDEVRLLAQQQVNQEQTAALAKQAEDLRANLAATRGALTVLKQLEAQATAEAEANRSNAANAKADEPATP